MLCAWSTGTERGEGELVGASVLACGSEGANIERRTYKYSTSELVCSAVQQILYCTVRCLG